MWVTISDFPPKPVVSVKQSLKWISESLYISSSFVLELTYYERESKFLFVENIADVRFIKNWNVKLWKTAVKQGIKETKEKRNEWGDPSLDGSEGIAEK